MWKTDDGVFLVTSDPAIIYHKSLSGDSFNYNHYEFPAFNLKTQQYVIFTDDEKVLHDKTPGRVELPKYERIEFDSSLLDQFNIGAEQLDRIDFDLNHTLSWTRAYNDGEPLGDVERHFKFIAEDLVAVNQ